MNCLFVQIGQGLTRVKAYSQPSINLYVLLVLILGVSINVVNAKEPLVLQNITLIDGTGAPAKPNQTLIIEGRTIKQLGPVDQIQVPDQATTIDLAGHYVMPGLVDLHVHFPEYVSVHQPMLNRLLEYGITTVLNPGARPGAGVELREQISRGKLTGPRLLTAGASINLRPTDGRSAGGSVLVSTADEMREAINAQAKAGVDFIKLYRRLPPDLVAAGVAAAEQSGLPVVGHMGETTWTAAANAGINMLVHSGWGTPMDEIVNLANPIEATDAAWYRGYADAPNGERFAAQVAALIKHEVTVVPTLSITQASGLGKDASLLPQFKVHLAPDAEVDNWWGAGWRERHPQYDPDSEEEAELLASIYFPAVLNILKAHHDRGVRIGVGTDVGNAWMTPGFVYHHELSLYQQAGIPPLEILTMATRNGAEALGILDQVGTITVGKQADLVVLAADPTVDINNTLTIQRVFLAGQEVVFQAK
ncbi:amidohydrolase family protein [Marinicella meishanensis]|uniref:amidohydrolase family protein n=1 Tax=Marinicella meishanensis TaxID=2873263 RepID=UPI001CBB0429|nr:amidohydrolase family protein [Marinicella sp. NBU2979]